MELKDLHIVWLNTDGYLNYRFLYQELDKKEPEDDGCEAIRHFIAARLSWTYKVLSNECKGYADTF